MDATLYPLSFFLDEDSRFTFTGAEVCLYKVERTSGWEPS